MKRAPKWSVILATAALLGLGASAEFGPSLRAATESRKSITPKTVPSMVLVPIPAGTFIMGHPTGKDEPPLKMPAGYVYTKDFDQDEGPPTRVTFSKPFWLGATDVTVGQWRQFCDATGYVTDAETGGGVYLFTKDPVSPSVFIQKAGTSWRNPGNIKQEENHPVVGVSWKDTQAFCVWLTEQERAAGRLPQGYVYTLPTEAQWEYACRAGQPYSHTETERLDDQTWYVINSGGNTHAVGQKRPNEWGLYDMHGNVWQWCLDWYAPYRGGDVTDPQGGATGTIRECRGGGWNSTPGHGISSANRWDSPGRPQRDNLGFRVALSQLGNIQ